MGRLYTLNPEPQSLTDPVASTKAAAPMVSSAKPPWKTKAKTSKDPSLCRNLMKKPWAYNPQIVGFI